MRSWPKRKMTLGAGVLIVLLFVLVFFGQQPVAQRSGSQPVRLAVLPTPDVQPHRLFIHDGKLYVLPLMGQAVHVFSYDGTLERVIPLVSNEYARVFTDLAVNSDGIYVTTEKGELFIFSREGELTETFGFFSVTAIGEEVQADETEMSAIAIALSPRNLYVVDVGTRQILVVSLHEVQGITDRFEMYMTIPFTPSTEGGQISEKDLLQKPIVALPTPGGRLLVGDAGAALLRVYSLHGGGAIDFPAEPVAKQPLAIALDGIETVIAGKPELSGGRVHLLDRRSRQVIVYSPEGDYLFSYGQGGRLISPSDIDIDPLQRLIFIVDMEAGIVKLSY